MTKGFNTAEGEAPALNLIQPKTVHYRASSTQGMTHSPGQFVPIKFKKL